ncbi:hypothetical protein HPB51_023451 [Rhipicephalus microplus]|uniref:Uncharacterized protein n=1 Tax=Rhipicephalus microplus TaxID=6941 RepID=A0A9J6F7W9_RHIMP|nr:hypothetical protein HPB51_023451 [Rhipicephalus microplus]
MPHRATSVTDIAQGFRVTAKRELVAADYQHDVPKEPLGSGHQVRSTHNHISSHTGQTRCVWLEHHGEFVTPNAWRLLRKPLRFAAYTLQGRSSCTPCGSGEDRDAACCRTAAPVFLSASVFCKRHHIRDISSKGAVCTGGPVVYIASREASNSRVRWVGFVAMDEPFNPTGPEVEATSLACVVPRLLPGYTGAFSGAVFREGGATEAAPAVGT